MKSLSHTRWLASLASPFIGQFWTTSTLSPYLYAIYGHKRPLSSSLSRSPSVALSFSRSHTPLPHTHSMSLPNSLLPPPAPMLSRYYTCHTIPPSLILGLHHQWSLYSTYTLSLSHTNACTNTHTNTHKHPFICILISPKNLLSLPQSLTYHTRTLSLSLANTLNKGFPVNNLPSIHQQSWQYGEHETWKRINLHVLRPPSMTTRTRASQKARRRHPLLVGDGKIFVLHSREVIVLRPHMPRRWIECRC